MPQPARGLGNTPDITGGIPAPASDRSDWREFNHVRDLTSLKNTYLVLRHGHADSNADQRISGDLEKGIKTDGLTPTGRLEVEASVRAANLGPDIIIVASPFLRTMQTAEILKEITGATTPIEPSAALRERGFGIHEGQHAGKYAEIGGRDMKDPFQNQDGVERAVDVAERTTQLIAELEKRFEGKTIVLVGHGDPHKILQACMRQGNPGSHAFAVSSLKNGQLRPLQFTPALAA
jgi:broad specificity phosphatase PhoE